MRSARASGLLEVSGLPAVPLAALADKTSRSWVIAISLAAWSGFTAVCGLAQNFWHNWLEPNRIPEMLDSYPSYP